MLNSCFKKRDSNRTVALLSCLDGSIMIKKNPKKITKIAIIKKIHKLRTFELKKCKSIRLSDSHFLINALRYTNQLKFSPVRLIVKQRERLCIGEEAIFADEDLISATKGNTQNLLCYLIR